MDLRGHRHRHRPRAAPAGEAGGRPVRPPSPPDGARHRLPVRAVKRAILWASLLAVAGAVGAAIYAAQAGWAAKDTLATVALAGGSALLASVGGALVLRRFRARSTRVQALVIALSSVLVLVV